MTKDEALAFDLALNALLWANVEINEWRDDAHGYTPEDQPQIMEAITAIKQALAAPLTHKTARWTDEEYREISDQVISTLVEYGAELRTADCQMQILREELAESRRGVDALVALARADEREKAKHNEEVLMNALWKACGDDGQMVEETIESQGELK
jgi:hypothetical protein